MGQDNPHNYVEALIDAVREVDEFCRGLELQYVVIGGLACARWAEPRATKDIDMTMIVRPEKLDSVVDAFFARFQPLFEGAVEMGHNERLMRGRSSGGVPIDMSLAIEGLHEEPAIQRAVPWEIDDGLTVPVLSLEDFIVFKCIAGRPERDYRDIEAAIARARGRMNRKLILRLLSEMAELVYPVDPVAVFEDQYTKAMRGIKQAEERWGERPIEGDAGSSESKD